MAKRRRPDLTDAEWKIMRLAWESRRVTAREVCDALEGETGWAYTTVKTLMDRLVAKRALEARLEGNTTRYVAALSRTKARRSAVKSLLDRAFDGAFAPLVHFLVEREKLTEEERAELLRMIEESEK